MRGLLALVALSALLRARAGNATKVVRAVINLLTLVALGTLLGASTIDARKAGLAVV